MQSGLHNSVLRQLVNIIGIITVTALAAWPFVQEVPDQALAEREPAPLQTGDELKPCTLNEPGYINISLYGSLQSELELQGDELLCSGKLDAVQSRSRLAFSAEQTAEGANLVFIIGMENVGDNANQQGVPTNVTILDQDNGLFFGTAGIGRCWTDLSLQPFEKPQTNAVYFASGEVYCAGAIPQIQGPGSVTISHFGFAGSLTAVTAAPE